MLILYKYLKGFKWWVKTHRIIRYVTVIIDKEIIRCISVILDKHYIESYKTCSYI